MTVSEDVSILFGKFGGEAAQYQELARDAQAAESKARWPLLASLKLAHDVVTPSVRKDHTPQAADAPVASLRSAQQASGHSPFSLLPEAAKSSRVMNARVVAEPVDDRRLASIFSRLAGKPVPVPAPPTTPSKGSLLARLSRL